MIIIDVVIRNPPDLKRMQTKIGSESASNKKLQNLQTFVGLGVKPASPSWRKGNSDDDDGSNNDDNYDLWLSRISYFLGIRTSKIEVPLHEYTTYCLTCPFHICHSNYNDPQWAKPCEFIASQNIKNTALFNF